MEKQDLICMLKSQTAEIYTEYLVETEKWAKEQVVRNKMRVKNYMIKYRNVLIHTLSWSEKQEYYKESKYAHNSPAWYFNTDEFVKRSLKNAEDHYDSAIQKLAYRILNKKMNIESLVVKSARIGVNLETVFTDGVQTVRAFTIVASGPVQRPHYRYLIK